MGVDLDLEAGFEGQGRRSKVKVKCKKMWFDITDCAIYLAQRSGSNIKI